MTTETRKRRDYTEDFKQDAVALVSAILFVFISVSANASCSGQVIPDTLLRSFS
jgi:hypothetical protein